MMEQGPICYSAGPGSGKTKTLVEEFYRALEDTGYDFGGVVAITFTDKAADEMVRRIAQEIREKSAERFTDFITSHRIGTIHSFCLSMLRKHTSMGSEVIDEKLAAVLRERAVGLCVNELVRGEDGELLLDNFGVERLREHLGNALEKRYLHEATVPDKAGYMKMSEEAFDELTMGDVAAIREVASVREDIRNAIGFYDGLAGYGSLTFGEKLSVVEKIVGIDCRVKPFKGSGISGHRSALEGVWRRCALTAENYQAVLGYEYSVLRALTKAFERAGELYGRVKERRMDYDDLLIRTYGLLRDRPDIARAEGGRIRFLLVDEFQDVDPLQYEIMGLLGVDNTRVFGDAKQSIYSFRGADVELFNLVSKRYARRALDRNYRSTPRLVSFFNEVTKNVFEEDAEGYMTPYQELEAVREDFPSQIGFDIAVNGDEAVLVAERILSVVGRLDVKGGRKAEYGDIAVLVDSTTRLQELTKALMERRIPYRISSGSGFFEAPEVRALVNLVSVLEDPYDDIALFGLLRSELFHISDAGIYEMSRNGGGSLYEKLPLELRGDLDRWLSLVDFMTPSELVGRIVRERSYRAVLALGERRNVSVRNVNKFIGLLRSFESSGVRSTHIIGETLRRFMELKAKEPEASEPELRENSVTIMTIHKAKGLEWPVVIVPYIYKRYWSNGTEMIFPHAGGLIGIRTNLEPFGTRRRESVTAIRLKEDADRRYEEERKRVLYVAMTRAMDHLFFTGTLGAKNERCWAREVFDKGDRLGITNLAKNEGKRQAIAQGANSVSVHFAVEFNGNAIAGLRPSHLPQPVRRAEEVAAEDMEFRSYEPPAEKIVVDPSYAKLLLECPARYYYARMLDLREDRLSGSLPEVRREADNEFYGSVVHRALELDFMADSGRIVEEVALSESVCIDDRVLAEGRRRIESAKAAFEGSGLRALMAEASDVMHEVTLVRDLGSFYIKGRADLVLSLDGRTMIVDYKTDNPAKLGGRIEEKGYDVQLALYSLCFDDPEVCIYSVWEGRLIPVPVDRRALLERMEQRAAALRDGGRERGERCAECFYKRMCEPESGAQE